MNIADSFYIALCMTVLLLGVVYWFWTQTQYLQRKINLLENIVYELKTSMDHGPKAPPVEAPPEGPRLHTSESPAEATYPPAPGSELGEDEDLLHEKLLSESEPPVAVKAVEPVEAVEAVPDDLQPGGVGSGMSDVEQKPRGGVLDGMTLKELRRLGEQRNVPGASNMRKQSLIEALRQEPPPAQEEASVATVKVGVVSPFEDAVELK